ncbi:MAG: c-type cytochrome [Bacteriovoracaceae bacterium]|jgi:cytochrome c553|nr:c-type cytochrome [Bacteriovoracaceae bacterium]
MRFLITLIFLSLLYSCGPSGHMKVEALTGENFSSSPGLSPFSIADFDNTIFPIFKEKCSQCHTGAGLPNWLDYDTVITSLKKIEDRLFVKQDMPMIGKLSEKEKSTIKDWIAAGAPKDASGEAKKPELKIPKKVYKSHGEKLAVTNCFNCHGKAGLDAFYPLLNGQTSDYLKLQLQAFKDGVRVDNLAGLMNGVAKALTDKEIDQVVSYLTSADPCQWGKATDPIKGDIASGKAKSSMCMGCHSDGNGMGAPKIEGQKALYIFESLSNFKSGKRDSAFMKGVAGPLTDAEIKNLASYFSSQSKCK